MEGQSRHALPPGTVLNGVYRVEAEVGQGGFGIVYRARHTELGYPVAIKEYLPAGLAIREGLSVHPRGADYHEHYQEGMDRFLEEAKQLIAFRHHPNIVSCRDFFRAHGTAYLVMEYEEGLPLAELLQAREEEGRPFDETDLRKVMVPLLEGLAQVHAAGVLHRDIKPGNILVRREDERPVLIDFGAAKQNFAEHTKSFAPLTEGYAAIEQVGEGKLGPWTDLYAVGAVMWRMVAGGKRPFEPPDPVKVESRSNAVLRGESDPMPSARELGRGRFSERVLKAIEKCLELREADRVQDCGELLGLLDTKKKRDERRRKFTAADGTVWEGPLVDGQRQGHWVARRADGTVGEGPFVDGQRQGHWVWRFADGNICEGPYVDDKRHGHWVERFADRSVQAGPFVDGQRHGDWVWRFADGSVYDVSYRNGEQVSSVRRGVAPVASEMRAIARKQPEARGERGERKQKHDHRVITIVASVATVLVAIGLGDLPYGYYMLLRLYICGASLFLLLGANLVLKNWQRWVLIGFVVLYNPVFPIYLGEKGLWIVLNILTVVLFWMLRFVRRRVVPAAAEPRPAEEVQSQLPGEAEAKPTRAARKSSRSWKWTAEALVMLAVAAILGLILSDPRFRENPDRASSNQAQKMEYTVKDTRTGKSYTFMWEKKTPPTDADVDRIIAAQASSSPKIPLASPFRVEPEPKDARIRIMNIKERYRPGMELPPGKYRVEVSAPGYEKTVELVEHGNEPTRRRIKLEARRNTGSTSYFTRGSHQDDVLRLQGTPSGINRYSSYEIWSYGFSTVKIDLRSKRVVEWSNSGNLKVKMQPVRSTGNTSYFTRGSHQDDVLRLQGTPSGINRYSSYEIWSYGFSTVKIDLRSKRVVEWSNSGNLKVKMQPGR